MIRFLVPLAGFVVLAVLLGVGLTMNPREVPSPLIGKPMPPFSAPTLHDPDTSIADADLQGRVSLVNVFASWCTACYQEHPVLQKFATLRPDTPLYGLNYKDEREDAQAWLSELGDPYRKIVFDHPGRVGIDWGVYGVPETFVLDHQGLIRHKHIGPISYDQLDETILPLIDQLESEART